MKRFVLSSITGLASLAAVLAPNARADVKLPSVIGSHMVLQRDKPLPIWGSASAGEDVTVQLDGKSVSTKADDNGAWKVTLPALNADGKAHTLLISGKNKIELEDILIGEVWIGSGQSNMEWSLAGSHDAKEAIPAADQPKIRLFQVPKVQTKKPASGRQGRLDRLHAEDRAELFRRALSFRVGAAEGAGRAGRSDQQLLGRLADRAVDGDATRARAACTTA